MKKVLPLLITLLFSATSIFAQVNLKNGLVACYPFNANAKDESGNGNNGTVNGATLTSDRFGKANSAYEPNAFSPNGDGTNDTWEIFSIAGNADVIVEIYNRWGELIFYSKG